MPPRHEANCGRVRGATRALPAIGATQVNFTLGVTIFYRSIWMPMVAAMVMAAALPAHAALTEEQLAKLAQNPIGNLISIPFQYNGNLNFGPEKGTQSILNIQPVIPISVNDDWNIITRTILPVVWLPALAPDDNSVRGISDLQFSAFLSPAIPGSWIWGVGG